MKPHLMPRSYCPPDLTYVRWDPIRPRLTITYNPCWAPWYAWKRAWELYPGLRPYLER